MLLTMVDLRHVETDVTLTRAERMAAEMRHLAAMNDARLAAHGFIQERKAARKQLAVVKRSISAIGRAENKRWGWPS